jgi:hypothetical protein
MAETADTLKTTATWSLPDAEASESSDKEPIPLSPGVWPGVLPGLPFVAPPIEPHPNRDHKIDLWLDEQIWGHRLWDAQSPWLIFLEFLNVAEACQRQDRLLADDPPYPLRYRPRQRMFLRNILFNSDDVGQVAGQYGDSGRAWEAWLRRIQETALGVLHRDFSYVRTRFHSFHDFSEAVRLVRGAVVERQTNKRWSSRFVFPFGPHALYIDLHISPTTSQPSREYINFGRSGELLYLMLARSSLRDAIAPHVREMVNGTNRWDRLVASLQPDGEDDQERESKSCYLPYLRHPVFDRLARDWLAIFRLRLPSFDAYPHLVALGALHLLRYHLWIASTWAQIDGPPSLVCEIVAPRKTLVRELSLRSYGQNDAMSTNAVEQFVERIRRSEAWKSAEASSAFVQCKQVLQEAVWWGDTYDGANDPDQLLAELKRSARKGHQQHVGQVHRTYGRQIGLVSRRGTTRFRYAPTDQLIKTLLFTTVERRMEFGEFLARLFEQYGLVIGDREAERVLPPDEFDRKAFRANARRLEQRLGSLGVLRRLSDACAYVENPYGRSSRDNNTDGRVERD